MKQIPPGSVGSILVKELERIHSVSLGFAHLLAILVQYQIVYQYVLIRRLALYKGGNGHQRVEPASRLIDTFTDEVSREQLLVEVLAVFERIVLLRERHAPLSNQQSITSGILVIGLPQTGQVRCTSSTYGLWSSISSVISSCAFNQFLPATYALQMSAFTSPDRNSVPQYLFLEIAQSLTFSSQLPNLFSPTKSGNQLTVLLLATS